MDSLDSAPIIGLTNADDTFNAVGLMGVYGLTVDPISQDVSLIAKRSNAVGESYIVSGAGFWTMAPCSTCLKIKSYSLGAGGALAIKFVTDHPFAAGSSGSPPSAKNRLDLDVFDLAAVIAPVTGAATPVTYSKTGASAYTGLAYNADGYTKELASVTSDNAAVPYFLVVDDSGSASPTYNKFAMGTTGKEFDVMLNIGGGAVPAFDIFLTMGYGASAKKATRLTPTYFNPEFNRKSAWKVEVTPPTPGWDSSDAITTHNVVVRVYDWQQSSVVSAASPYGTETDTTKVYAASTVKSVSVEIPGMTSALQTLTTAGSGTGGTTSPLVYTFPIANTLLLPPGEYTSLVKVTDIRTPGAAAAVDSIVHTADGIALNWYTIPEFATYQTFVAKVNSGCGPITGYIVSPPLANVIPITGVGSGNLLNFVVTADSGGPGNIVKYEIDADYDGTTYTADSNNTTGIFNGVTFTVPSCASNVPKTFTVAFRATDSCTPANVTIFRTCQVIVEYCPPAGVGNITLTVNRLSPGGGYDLLDNRIDDEDSPWTLGWASQPAGTVEYAIYYDNDPGDLSTAQLTDNLTLVGVTSPPALTYKVPLSHWTDPNHYVKGNTYVVRARSAVGFPGSESVNSQLAFIKADGWDTLNPGLGFGWSGGTGNSEGWVVATSNSYYQTDYNWNDMWYPIWNDSTYYVSQPNSLQLFGYYTGSSYCGNLGMTAKTPTIADTSVRTLTSAMSFYGWDTSPYPYGGVIVGQCSTQPTTDFDGRAMTWLNPKTTAPYSGYNSGFSGFPYTGVGGGKNCFSFLQYDTTRFLLGVDFTMQYIGFGSYTSSPYGNNQVDVDDLAIVIY